METLRMIAKEELIQIIEKHRKWIYDELNGERANLCDANLCGADLCGANLRGADLCGADLRDADLKFSPNLTSAKTDQRFIQFNCIGSRKGTTLYCFNTDTIWCGCFKGTLAEFAVKVEETHKNNPQYLAEYRAVILMIQSLSVPQEGRK